MSSQSIENCEYNFINSEKIHFTRKQEFDLTHIKYNLVSWSKYEKNIDILCNQATLAANFNKITSFIQLYRCLREIIYEFGVIRKFKITITIIDKVFKQLLDTHIYFLFHENRSNYFEFINDMIIYLQYDHINVNFYFTTSRPQFFIDERIFQEFDEDQDEIYGPSEIRVIIPNTTLIMAIIWNFKNSDHTIFMNLIEKTRENNDNKYLILLICDVFTHMIEQYNEFNSEIDYFINILAEPTFIRQINITEMFMDCIMGIIYKWWTKIPHTESTMKHFNTISENLVQKFIANQTIGANILREIDYLSVLIAKTDDKQLQQDGISIIRMFTYKLFEAKIFGLWDIVQIQEKLTRLCRIQLDIKQ